MVGIVMGVGIVMIYDRWFSDEGDSRVDIDAVKDDEGVNMVSTYVAG